jgi:hypothetical protein
LERTTFETVDVEKNKTHIHSTILEKALGFQDKQNGEYEPVLLRCLHFPTCLILGAGIAQ